MGCEIHPVQLQAHFQSRWNPSGQQTDGLDGTCGILALLNKAVHQEPQEPVQSANSNAEDYYCVQSPCEAGTPHQRVPSTACVARQA